MAHPKLNDGALACIRVGMLAGRPSKWLMTWTSATGR